MCSKTLPKGGPTDGRCRNRSAEISANAEISAPPDACRPPTPSPPPVSPSPRPLTRPPDCYRCERLCRAFFLPGLMKELQEGALGVDVYIGQPDITVLDGKLESGDIDIALGFEAVMQLPAHLHRVPLFQDRMACMVRRDHPHVGDELTFAQFVDTCSSHPLERRPASSMRFWLVEGCNDG